MCIQCLVSGNCHRIGILYLCPTLCLGKPSQECPSGQCRGRERGAVLLAVCYLALRLAYRCIGVVRVKCDGILVRLPYSVQRNLGSRLCGQVRIDDLSLSEVNLTKVSFILALRPAEQAISRLSVDGCRVLETVTQHLDIFKHICIRPFTEALSTAVAVVGYLIGTNAPNAIQRGVIMNRELCQPVLAVLCGRRIRYIRPAKEGIAILCRLIICQLNGYGIAVLVLSCVYREGRAIAGNISYRILNILL